MVLSIAARACHRRNPARQKAKNFHEVSRLAEHVIGEFLVGHDQPVDRRSKVSRSEKVDRPALCARVLAIDELV